MNTGKNSRLTHNPSDWADVRLYVHEWIAIGKPRHPARERENRQSWQVITAIQQNAAASDENG
jgi:hypothetical protein